MLNEDIELKSSDIDSTSTEEAINVGNNSERKTIKEKEDIKLLYGNNINIREPKKIGNISAFLYPKNGWPIITIGPDCIIILLIYI